MITPLGKPTWRDRITAYLGRWSRPEVVVSCLLLLVTALQAWILLRQTDILDQQRRDAIEGGKQTQAIVDAEKIIARASQSSANSMRDSVAQAKTTLTATLEQSRKSLQLSRKSLERTIEISRDDQRAWLGFSAITGIKEIKEGSMLNLDVAWVNSGRSPALRVQGATGFHCQSSGTAFVPVYRPDVRTPSISVLQQNARHYSKLHLDRPISKQEADDILTGKQILYVFGRVTYDDVSGRHHQTTFACYLQPSRSEPPSYSWRALNTYNTAD